MFKHTNEGEDLEGTAAQARRILDETKVLTDRLGVERLPKADTFVMGSFISGYLVNKAEQFLEVFAQVHSPEKAVAKKALRDAKAVLPGGFEKPLLASAAEERNAIHAGIDAVESGAAVDVPKQSRRQLLDSAQGVFEKLAKGHTLFVIDGLIANLSSRLLQDERCFEQARADHGVVSDAVRRWMEHYNEGTTQEMLPFRSLEEVFSAHRVTRRSEAGSLAKELSALLVREREMLRAKYPNTPLEVPLQRDACFDEGLLALTRGYNTALKELHGSEPLDYQETTRLLSAGGNLRRLVELLDLEENDLCRLVGDAGKNHPDFMLAGWILAMHHNLRHPADALAPFITHEQSVAPAENHQTMEAAVYMAFELAVEGYRS